MSKKCYLSGPITGLSYIEAIGWTDYAKNKLKEISNGQIEGYRPLRGKGTSLSLEQNLSAMGYATVISNPKAIVGRDSYDVISSDVILVNLLEAKRISIGTMFEVAWAWLLRKPIILIMEKDGNIHMHGFVTETCTYWVEDLNQGIELVKLILLDE